MAERRKLAAILAPMSLTLVAGAGEDRTFAPLGG
jgi:hypothetical protein